jgi:hypothetical protein
MPVTNRSECEKWLKYREKAGANTPCANRAIQDYVHWPAASSFNFFGLFWPKCDGTRISQLGQQADLFPNGTLAVGPCGYLRHFLYVYHASPRA